MPLPKPALDSALRRGFTLIELVAVVVVIALLSGVATAAVHQHRQRVSQAEMREDLMHFVNQQQRFARETGAYATSLALLEDAGWRTSPNVVVEAQNLTPQRTYVRVRNTKTSARCSVDYSTSSQNAINRIQCFGGIDLPGSELTGAGDGAVAAMPGTGTIDTASAPPAPPACAVAPVVSGPANIAGNPGQSYTQTFTVQNPGTCGRAYSIRVATGNPAVVPSVSASQASVNINPGAVASIDVTFSIDPAAAGHQSTAIPLEAVDAGEPSLMGSDFFTVGSNLVLAAPSMTSPPNVTVVPGQETEVAWSTTNQVNAARMVTLAASQAAGLAQVSSSGLGILPFAKGESKLTQVRFRLDAGVDGGTTHNACLTATDQEATSLSLQRCMTVTATILPGAPTITGPAARTEMPNATFTQSWSVTNTTNAPRSFQITPGQGGDLTLVSSTNTGFAVMIGRGQTITVTATYRLSATSLYQAASTTTLSVVDPGFPAQSSGTQSAPVTTALALADPTVGGAPGVAANPGATGSLVYSLRNNSNAARTFTFTYASNGNHVAAPAGTPASVTVPAFGTTNVTGGFSVPSTAEGGWSAMLTLGASDAGAPSFTGSAGGVVTVNTVLAAPTISPAAGQWGNPGTTGTLGYALRNNSNVARTFSFAYSSNGDYVAAAVGVPANVTVPAFGTVPVSGAWSIPSTAQGGWSATLTLTGRDVNATGYTHSSTGIVTVNTVLLAPTTAAIGSGVSGTYGQSATIAYTITNRSNVTRSFVLSPSAGNAAIIDGFAPLPQVTLGAYASTTVHVSLRFSATPSGNLGSPISLTTSDAATTSLSSSDASSATRINTPPTLRLTCNAASVLSLTDLGCTITATDPDGMIDRRDFAKNTPGLGWTYTNDAPATLVVNFARSGAGQVAARVVDNNGAVDADAATGTWLARPITVLNRRPTLSVSCGANTVLSLTDLGCTITAADLDGEIASYNHARNVPGIGWTAYTYGSAANFAVNFSRSGAGRVAAYVTDNMGDSDASHATGTWYNIPITVQNRRPTLSLSCGPNTVLSLTDLGCVITASDPDGDIASYHHARNVPGIGWTAYTDNSAANFTVNFARSGQGYVAAHVRDNMGDSDASHATGTWHNIPVTVQNRRPTLSLACDKASEFRNTAVGCTITAADPDGEVVSYSHAKNEPGVGWVGHTNDSPARFSVSFARPGAGGVAAYVTDNMGDSDAAHATGSWHNIPLTVINRPPTAVLRVRFPRTDRYIYNDEAVQLDLLQSTDPEGDALTGNLSSGMTGVFGTGNLEVRQHVLTGTVTDEFGASSSTVTEPFEVRPKVIGCMEPGALNYNPEATHQDESVECRYVQPPVARFRLWQDGTPSSRFWLRKWTYADPSSSQPGENATRIVSYRWSWGMFMARWDEAQGRFVFDGTQDWAVSESTTPDVQRRAWDWANLSPEICLTVTNEAGLSNKTCQTVPFLRETRARLSWHYWSDWIDHANGWDSPTSWFGNGHTDHGQQRHTFDANPSLGDVAIRRVWMTVKLRGQLKNDGGPWAVEMTPDTRVMFGQDDPALIEKKCGTRDIMSYKDGRFCFEHAWRLETQPRSDGVLPPMYQPFFLGRDGMTGRRVDRWTTHSEFTLHVEDVDGRVTTETRNRFHANWQDEHDLPKYNWFDGGPSAWFENESPGEDGSTLVLSGLTGGSTHGRVVSTWFNVEYDPGNGDQESAWNTTVYGQTSYEMGMPECGTLTVTAFARDDEGRLGYGRGYRLSPVGKTNCPVPGGGDQVVVTKPG